MSKIISLATGKPIGDAKALIVTAEGERFALRMSPALTDYERRIVNFYDRRTEALAAADYLSSVYPTLYRTVIDRASVGEAG